PAAHGDNRSYAAAGPDEEDFARGIVKASEFPGWAFNRKAVSQLYLLIEPVRHETTGHAFDGNLKKVRSRRTRRHTVRTFYFMSVDIQNEGYELTWMVGEQ